MIIIKEDLMNYRKQANKQIGECSICKRYGRLTWDHVPPKSILFEPNTIAGNLFELMPNDYQYKKRFQSGIKYRTICEKCNNAILGEYDKAYKAFMLDVAKKLTNELMKIGREERITGTLCLEVPINRIIRAICGHFLSMKTKLDDVTVDKELRSYLLNQQEQLTGLNLYCWLYPYDTVLNVRDIVVAGMLNSTHPRGFISVMSTFPLAFIITPDRIDGCRLDDLGKYSTANIDEVVSIQLRMETLLYADSERKKDYDWPLNVKDDNYGAAMVLSTKDSIEDGVIGVASPQ